jgi:hypothetical protein
MCYVHRSSLILSSKAKELGVIVVATFGVLLIEIMNLGILELGRELGDDVFRFGTADDNVRSGHYDVSL